MDLQTRFGNKASAVKTSASKTEPVNIFALDNCSHIFHSSCLQTYYKTQIDSCTFPLTCPDVDCRKEVCFSDLRDLFSSGKSFEKYLERTLSLFAETHKEFMYCPNPRCEYFFVKTEDKELICEKCNGHFCLTCEVPFHVGQSCDQYQVSNSTNKSDKKFLEHVERFDCR